jgi:molybdopterin-guanine dinucleotide biosynthesis protein A
MVTPAVSVAILAGGRGERLGRDKATLTLGGRTLVQRLVDLLVDLSDDILVVLRPDQNLNVDRARAVTDLPPYSGALAGLAAALEAARHEWCVAVACDMPFVNLQLLRYMASLTPGYEVVMPRLPVGLEPLYALYHKRCLPALRKALGSGQRRLVSFHGSVRVRYVSPQEITDFDPTGRSFFNINTPQELAQAELWLQEGQTGQP